MGEPAQVTLETFYTSDEWRSFRERLMLKRTNERGELICEYCGSPITKTYDCIGHHDVKLTSENVNDYAISLNETNVKLVHHRCHNIIHKRFEGFCQEVFIVYGSPCSGKTSWVKSVANDDDLILDIDNIWTAICTSDRYHKPNRLKANVFGIRDCLLEQIKMRTGKWRNAYIIGTYPLRTDRDRLCTLLRARLVYIEATKQECLERCTTDEWKTFVEDWWQRYTP